MKNCEDKIPILYPEQLSTIKLYELLGHLEAIFITGIKHDLKFTDSIPLKAILRGYSQYSNYTESNNDLIKLINSKLNPDDNSGN